MVFVGDVSLDLDNLKLLGGGSSNKFIVGCPVKVARRKWPGINKDEMVGIVSSVMNSGGQYLYDVEYLPGFGDKREALIAEHFVEAHEEQLSGRSTRSGVTEGIGWQLCYLDILLFILYMFVLLHRYSLQVCGSVGRPARATPELQPTDIPTLRPVEPQGRPIQERIHEN